MITDFSEALLHQILPNVLASAKGEATLVQKLDPYLDLAEMWVQEVLVPFEIFTQISCGDEPETDHLRRLLRKVIAYDAMHRAIPNLDLVLTPNGFGIVSNSNIAPASRDRVDRLMGSMIAHRDAAIAQLLRDLPRIEPWVPTETASFFYATLFPDFSLCKMLGVKENLWDNFLSLREQVIPIEHQLAEKYFSEELLDALRYEWCTTQDSMSKARAHVVKLIQANVISIVKGNAPDLHALADIVNFIRGREADFTEWVNSDTALLYVPINFKNTKRSGGYFF